MKATEIIGLVKTRKLSDSRLQEARTKINNRIVKLQRQIARGKYQGAKLERKTQVLGYNQTLIKEIGQHEEHRTV